jgi:hypothetical protein
MLVYLVRQTQPVDYYEQKTIYVCSTKEKAQEYCRTLNKEYGYGVKFNDEWDFIDLDDDYEHEQQHYYDWECMELDEELVLLQ